MYGDGMAVAELDREWERLDRDLEQEAKDLLCEMVEAERSVSREERRKFMFVKHSMGAELLHPGLSGGHSIVVEDIEILAHYGLLLTSFGPKGTALFSIAPAGKRYYERLRSDEGQRVGRIEQVTKRYLETGSFGKRHPQAYACWKKADDLLWSEDVGDRQSEIGHNCRDALVAFVTGLVERYKPADVDDDAEKFLNRLGAVVADREISKNVSDAVYHLWEAARGLVMRQDHKERQRNSLTVEDGRRAVFLTAMALVEADRFLR